MNRRLLLVVDSTDGGLAAVACRHRDRFRAQGWDVEVAGPRPGPNAQVAPDRLVDVPGTARRLRQLLHAAGQLRTVAGDGWEVVHCHGPRSLLVARLAGIRGPYATIHGTGPVASDPAGYRTVRRLAVRSVPQLARCAFSAAPELPPPWQFVPHASPRLATLAQLPPATAPPPTFLWLARLDEGRPAGDFVRAIAELAQRRPVRGVVAGTGPDTDAVAELAGELEAPVEFVGHADPAPLLAACSGLVLLSRHEALNFAVQEAMWSGRAVVTSPLPGLRWLAGDTGRYVTDVSELTGALTELCEPEVAAHAGAAAAERIRAVIHPDDPWPAIEAAYGSRRARGRFARNRSS